MAKFSSPTIDKITSFLLDLFYPKKCLICGQYGDYLCLDCARGIELIRTTTCPKCAKISVNGQYCKSCKNNRKVIFAKGIVVAAHYDAGPVKELIHHYKYLGFRDLSEIFAELIYQQIKTKFNFKNTVIVPVPLHIRRFNQRGYNQAELIARSLSNKLSLPGGDALVRTRETKTQVGLTRTERLRNLDDAFVCNDIELINGKNIILVDDVATTGATINECAKALKLAGAREVWGVVVARNI